MLPRSPLFLEPVFQTTQNRPEPRVVHLDLQATWLLMTSNVSLSLSESLLKVWRNDIKPHDIKRKFLKFNRDIALN